LNLRDDGVGDLFGLRRIGDANERDDELVTAGPCDQVPPSGVAFQDPSHLTQHVVTTLVSVRVVHLLEIVQVDLQESELGGSLP
jgi:hypothetical protein